MIRFVYIAGVSTNPVKIGVADDPFKRMQLLQIGCPDELKLFEALPFPHFAAPEIEKAAHDALADKHRRGEWFNVSADQAKAVVETLAPPIVDRTTERRRASGDILTRLDEYGIHNQALDAIGFYRRCLNDPSRREALEQCNSAIMKVAGIAGLETFKLIIVQHHAIRTGLYRSPGLQRKAEATLARAINALARFYFSPRNGWLDISSNLAA